VQALAQTQGQVVVGPLDLLPALPTQMDRCAHTLALAPGRAPKGCSSSSGSSGSGSSSGDVGGGSGGSHVARTQRDCTCSTLK
jgi:uncharacterized membrane protein YgcG